MFRHRFDKYHHLPQLHLKYFMIRRQIEYHCFDVLIDEISDIVSRRHANATNFISSHRPN